MKRVTVEEIAEKVGVSKGLVSRALTGKLNVSDKVRDEITRTALAMGYDFGRLRSNNRKRSKCVLVMSSNMLLKEEYWQPIIQAIISTLDEAHINLEYFIYDEKNYTRDDISRLKSLNASGYFFMHNNPRELLEAVESTNRTVVVVDPKTVQTGKHLQVKYNNFNSFYEMTSRLIEKGHRHFMFYGPLGSIASFNEREQGVVTCVRDHTEMQTSVDEVLFSNESGNYADNERFEKCLKAHPEITAIFCANDIIAMNAKLSIERLGKKVPDDYSLVGFDNIRESGEDNIDLTTVNVPRTELGCEAARYLIKHISNQQIRYSQIVIDCEIVERGSVKQLLGKERTGAKKWQK